MTDLTLDDMRDRLVLAALAHIPFDGWSLRALHHAAQDCGFDASVPQRLFPHGVIDAVEHFTRLADARMADDAQALLTDADKVRDRLFKIIQARLMRWQDHKEAVRRALSVYALPTNLTRAAAATARTADAIWRAAGDRSNDFNWYTKRASLTGIYAATLLYWLDDTTEESVDTWDYLHRRLDGMVAAIRTRQSIQKKVEKTFSHLPGPFALLAQARRLRPRMPT